MEDKTPLDLAREREVTGEVWYCDECEYIVIIKGTPYCGISGKLLHPMMFERGQGTGAACSCGKRKGAKEMGLSPQDLARLGPSARRQVLEKLGMDQAKARKYHNKPDTRGALHFDSRKEARRFDELMVLLRAGKIRKLELQRQFTLQESYITPEGERVRAIKYVADFAYERVTEPDAVGEVHWLPVVEDVKSTATKTEKYKIKAKLLKERYGLTITEV